MMWGSKLEMRLPSRRALGVTLGFGSGVEPDERGMRQLMRSWGYSVAEGSWHIARQHHHVTWQFVMVANTSRPEAGSLFELSRLLRQLEGVDSLQLSHARN